MQSVLESIWSDILEFHSKALRIFSHSSELSSKNVVASQKEEAEA